ncbi:aspartyl protease family protein [Chryseobacterium populi]|uniref:Retroviral aspartyl protease n=1 Tax=Chryseobacterium populi TaxID=1144316 RepID=J2JK86_9FLAO|nr:aspartyl protease family protein [Chryseobacterium populi]EJL68310.1 Retroviral aspartyl protease [Chryseobacterium populi]
MKKISILFFIFCVVLASAQGKKFFEGGEVQLKNPVEKINLNFTSDLPFVKVSINGKTYNFLFDSGAPTVISNGIYTELNLEKKHKSKVKDSQKNKQEQIFTQLPEMMVDNVVFKNIGVMVMDLTISELGCFKIDGILGANQMAKLFWRVNYSENSLEATTDLANFDTSGYKMVIPFETKPQKTPVVETKILDRNVSLSFDTGFTGRLKVSENNYDPKKVKQAVETYGTNAVGAFGAGKPEVGYIFRTDKLSIGNESFTNEMVMTGNSNLIGNDFFKDYIFIMDWKNNKMYMKRIINEPSKFESFGFGYRFIDAKPMVSLVFQGGNLPLTIGDSIISINGVNLENLDKESACHYFINRLERGLQTVDVTVKRNGKLLDFKLDKKEYLQTDI